MAAELKVQPGSEDIYTIYSPSQGEWRERDALLEAARSAIGDKPCRGVIVDMDNVTYLSSAGIAGVFGLRKYLKEEKDADLVVARPTRVISRLLETVEMPRVIPVVSSLEEAREKLIESGAESAW